jgi:hypothetical protein
MFVQNHGDKTQEQMAQLWTGDISSRTISRALKRIGFNGLSSDNIRDNFSSHFI